MRSTLIVAPAIEPVPLSLAKQHCIVEHNADDTLINSYITAARHMAERATGRALITQTWQMVFCPCDRRAPNRIEPSPWPLQEVVSVTDANGPIDLADLDIALGDYPAIVRRSGAFTGEVTATVKCGYGSEASAVPPPVIEWMLLHIATFYAQRETHTDRLNLQPLSFVDGLLDAYRVFR